MKQAKHTAIHIYDGGGHTSRGWHQRNKALVIQPGGQRSRGKPRNRWEDDIPDRYDEMGIPMTEVNSWTKDRQPIVSTRRRWQKSSPSSPAAK